MASLNKIYPYIIEVVNLHRSTVFLKWCLSCRLL